MPTFKQKNVIKSYKLRLQEKLKTISEETQNATHFLNNRLVEFSERVQQILEIKDEKCLSLYRRLIRDLESYSEKLFILQASFEDVTEESASSEDELTGAESVKLPPKTLSDLPPQVKTPSTVPYFSAEEDVNFKSGCQDEDGGSFTEDDFCSLHSDNNVQNTNDSTLLNYQIDGCHIELISDSKYESNINASQSSCYRSISSNISESFSFHTDNNSQCVEPYSLESKNKGSLESSRLTFVIQPTNVEVSSHFSATLSCITDPGNFWIQIENSDGSTISFPKSECVSMSKLPCIKEGSYCLAPFKSTSFYYRAKSLSDAKSENELVKILFIDHGSTQDISLCDLRPLPVAAYAIPAQAIHCYLHGILPKKASWSNEAIERFKDFQNCCIETFVKSKEESYGVELVAKLAAELDEDFSVDIAQALCLDGLAVTESHGQNISLNQFSREVYNKADSSLEVSGSYDINAISSDSGVSVTSAYKSSQVSKKKNAIFNKDSEDCNSSIAMMNKFIFPYNANLIGFNHDTQIKDLISFDSCDALGKIQNSIQDLKLSDRCFTSSCLVCKGKDFCLHLKIPSPSLLFVEKDMVVVMLSHIVNPHEFYVNMAIENVVTLDDLREQMTNIYESQQNWQQVNIEDLSENMFCAGRFAEDNYWYRFKILQMNPEDLQRHQVFGQFVDYGNVATVKLCDLQPLTPQFSQHPIFAIKCSLAGVTPISDEMSSWNEDAINAFKMLTSFDRCLTAQICNDLVSDQDHIYPVLLWDTKDSQDLLINSSLADHKVAVFDYTLLCPSLPNQNAAKPCKEANQVKSYSNVNCSNDAIQMQNQVLDDKDIDSWDPMLEEYYDTDNSYALNDENLEVVTTGYQARDEKYICKYFSLRGHCPRGENCPHKHLPLLETGVTRDQEEVYCLDSFPIISEDVSNIVVQVSAIVNPGHFYVILPFGCKTVEKIDDLVYNGSPYSEIINTEAKTLFYALDNHYSQTPFRENTTVALSCGTIVAAKRKWDEKWHRGRIVDVIGINKPAKVFFVDSGDQEWVSPKFIRTISPKFLHTPFQAIQCSLYQIEPIGYENGSSWSLQAMNFFKDLVAGEILLAEIALRFGQVFHVSLRKTSRHNHQSIAQLLVSTGYAQYNKVIPSDKKKILYVPG